MLDEAYERFVTKKGGEIKQERKRAKRINPDADAELLEGGEDDGDVEMDQDFDEDQDQEANPLLFALDEQKPTKEQIVKQWYSQDVFTEAATGVTERSDTEDEREILQRNKKMDTGKREKVAKAQDLQHDGFEIVPAEPVQNEEDSSSSSDESEDDIDDYRKAEVLAYAKKMLRKKQREQILDDAYNKHMFDDEGLPNWFVEDEKRHRQPMKPVSREEVAAMRAQFKEIDARPSKKVAEAKARKKRVAMKKLDKARQKADAIADQNDINELSKRKMIDRIYRKAMPKKPQKEYVVAKKGVQVRAGKGKVLVDPRMKKDKRASGTGKKGGKGAKGKGGQKGMRGKAGKKAGKAPR
ncbi:FtsJ-like methyltransferase family protein [Zea mays]|nr:FtsJ-like methyltransferase family protein [Zea mays]